MLVVFLLLKNFGGILVTQWSMPEPADDVEADEELPVDELLVGLRFW